MIEWFREQVEEAGGANYQSLINAALREHIRQAPEPLEKTRLRRRSPYHLRAGPGLTTRETEAEAVK